MIKLRDIYNEIKLYSQIKIGDKIIMPLRDGLISEPWTITAKTATGYICRNSNGWDNYFSKEYIMKYRFSK